MQRWIPISYFTLFLTELGCQSIRASQLSTRSKKQIFSFDSTSIEFIHALIKNLNLKCNIYNTEERYVLIMTSAELINLAQTHAKHQLNECKLCLEDYSLVDGNDRFWFTKKNHKDLKNDYLALAQLSERGLNYREITHTELLPLPVPQGDHYAPIKFWERHTKEEFIAVVEPDKLFSSYGKKWVEKTYLDHNTAVKNQVLKAMERTAGFEEKLIPVVFSFLQNTHVVETKERKERALISEEKKEKKFPAIETYVNKLQQEIDHPFLFFNSDRKRKKQEFLNSILNLKKTNPSFSIKFCIEIIKNEDPKLYSQAMAGVVSKRMGSLLEEFTKDEQSYSSQNTSLSLD